MSSDESKLLFELFERAPRQGPGSAESTRRALALLPRTLRIERVLDLGCGCGASTLVLAAETGAQVVAVDIHAPFLARLRASAERQGLAERITTLVADLRDVDALGTGFDLVWAEGSAYSIGFENALRRWRALLRPAGCAVVSELVWFSGRPSARAREHFAAGYPDLRDEATRIAQARDAGYTLLGSFRLPASDWRDYYAGVRSALREAVALHGERELYAALRRECELYEACGDEYGYVCLVLQAPGGAA